MVCPVRRSEPSCSNSLRAGARLQYHGDFDWPGIGIGNLVMGRWNAAPWRFGTADYLLAVDRCSAARQHKLDAASVEASWDPELGSAMRERGLAIAEEAVVQALLGDLRLEEPVTILPHGRSLSW